MIKVFGQTDKLFSSNGVPVYNALADLVNIYVEVIA